MLKGQNLPTYFQTLVKNLCKSMIKVEDCSPHILYEHLMKNQQLIDTKLDERTKLQLIIFLGIHNSRKKFPQCKQIVFNLLKQTIIGDNRDDNSQAAISLSNLGIYHTQILNSVQDQLKNDENPDTKIILNILWCFQKLYYKYDKSLFCDLIGKKKLDFNESQRLIWMLSNEEPINNILLQENLFRYIKLQKKEQCLNFTPKVSYNFCQTMFNVYPGLINLELQQVHDFNQNDHHFGQLKESYIIARSVLQNNIKSIDQTDQEFSYFHKNFKTQYNDPIKNSHVFCLSQNTQARNTSRFEANIQSILEELFIKFTMNQNISIYEIDFLIDRQIIEANGNQHFIWSIESDLVTYTLNTNIKLRHLKELGYNDVIMLDARKWDQLDPRQKQVDYLKNLLIK